MSHRQKSQIVDIEEHRNYALKDAYKSSPNQSILQRTLENGIKHCKKQKLIDNCDILRASSPSLFGHSITNIPNCSLAHPSSAFFAKNTGGSSSRTSFTIASILGRSS